MGRGRSSDVYYVTIQKVEGRKLTVIIKPTGAGGIYLPTAGIEGIIVGFLWEHIEFAVRYRTDPDKPLGRMVQFRANSFSYNGMDVTEWVEKKMQAGMARDDWANEWQRRSEEEQAKWAEKLKEQERLLQEKQMQLIREKGLAPLSELSVDDICSSMKWTWRYVQRCRLVRKKGYTEDQSPTRALKNPVTGTFEVILTSEKWLRGIPNVEGMSEGTTASESPMGPLPPWSRELHTMGYAPVSFTLRVIVLLMARLPRHAPNFLSQLPVDVFWLVIAALWKTSHEEAEVPQWEVRWLLKRRERLSGAVEGATEPFESKRKSTAVVAETKKKPKKK